MLEHFFEIINVPFVEQLIKSFKEMAFGIHNLVRDPSGSLPDGRTFTGPDGLRTILDKDRDDFTQCMTSKLLTYALGRGLERYDRSTVTDIAKHVAAQNNRFSSLIMEIVSSRPFQMRKGDRTK